MIPNDPMILLSYVNTKLRDEYPSFDELCSSLGTDREKVEKKLSDAGFIYDNIINRFIEK